MQKIKYQTQRVTIAIGNYAAEKFVSEPITLDQAYHQVIGVSVHIVNDSGVANGDYKLGLQNDNGVIHDPTHIGGWATAKNDGTNPNERFKDFTVDIRGGGQIQCQAILPAQNLLTALTVDFVFKIVQNQERIA